jgi:2-haloacid dehalogenase
MKRRSVVAERVTVMFYEDRMDARSDGEHGRETPNRGRAMTRRTLLFDTWGTLVDNYGGPAEALEPYVFEAHMAMRIAIDWRFQQKYAMFYTTLANAFVPHPGLTEASLRWALEKNGVELSEDAIADVMSQYHKLRAYPEVLDALKALKEQGHTLKIVANPTKEMIEAHSRFAGTYDYLDEIISSGDEAHAFKPSPKVFQLGIERAGCPKEDILWVTGHFWEIVGAHRQGLRTAWINRARLPKLQIGTEPTYTTLHLLELAEILAGEREPAASPSR